MPKGKSFAGLVTVLVIVSAAVVLYGNSAIVPLSKISRTPIPFQAGGLCWACAAFLLTFAFYRIRAFFDMKSKMKNEGQMTRNQD
jgi:hypothetical protein